MAPVVLKVSSSKRVEKTPKRFTSPSPVPNLETTEKQKKKRQDTKKRLSVLSSVVTGEERKLETPALSYDLAQDSDI